MVIYNRCKYIRQGLRFVSCESWNYTRIQSCLLLVALQTSSHNQYTPVIELLFTAIQTEIETEIEAEI